MSVDEHASLEVTPDFIFGTLATDELRLQSLRAERGGLWLDRSLLLDPLPGQPLTLQFGIGPSMSADRLSVYYTTDGSPPAGRRGVAEEGSQIAAAELAETLWDTLLWGYGTCWRATIPGQPAGTVLRCLVEAWQSAGDSNWLLFEEIALTVDSETSPQWLREAVIYHIFVDRFAPSPDADFALPDDPMGGFYGGTLRGVIDRLDYIRDLGATCIWLSPIFPSPTHHGYDATDYATIEPRLGTDEEIRTLFAEAHQRGIRVLLDYVASHCSSAHPAFLTAQANQRSDEYSWFMFFEWPDDYNSFFGVREMPSFDTDDPGARQYLLDHAVLWLEAGADGFRLDYANGPTHAFWAALRRAVRAAKSDAVMLGEVVETPTLQRSYAGLMDGSLDFLLLQALRGFFVFETLTPGQMASFLERHFAYFPPEFVLPSFLDNHDMNRIMWAARNDQRRVRLAALCQLTLPGPPIIYYGTEVGMTQDRDVRYADGSGHPEHSRMPMLWDERQDRGLQDFYRQAIALRRAGGGVWSQGRELVLVDDARRVLAYRCGEYLLAFNMGTATTLDLAAWAGASLALGTDGGVAWDSAGSLELPALTGAVLRRA